MTTRAHTVGSLLTSIFFQPLFLRTLSWNRPLRFTSVIGTFRSSSLKPTGLCRSSFQRRSHSVLSNIRGFTPIEFPPIIFRSIISTRGWNAIWTSPMSLLPNSRAAG